MIISQASNARTAIIKINFPELFCARNFDWELFSILGASQLCLISVRCVIKINLIEIQGHRLKSSSPKSG